MAQTSKIGWTDATANFWVGCKKVSPACKFCYMFRDYGGRYKNDPTKVKRTKDGTFRAALSWKEPRKIFTCSWSDFFIEDADGFRADAWDVIRRTPQHSWQILTKRPERIMQCLPDDWGAGWDNVWFGVSVEDQKRSDERLEIFRDIPAKIKFLSVEPLLSSVDLSNWFVPALKIRHLRGTAPAVDWIIVGGESGNETGPWKYRNCEIEWIESVAQQCHKANIPVFIKQLGTALARRHGMKDKTGADINEWPRELFQNLPTMDVQEFPRVGDMKRWIL